MINKKVVFDIDDTLWGLNKQVCLQTGISYEKIITFSVHENPLLTEIEKQKMLAAYGNPEIFKNIKWFKGIERIMKLKNADIYLNSNSINDKCSEFKRNQIHEILDISDDHIIINTVGHKQNNIIKKTIDKDSYIFIDDSPHNISMSPAKYNTMIRTPWNQSESVKAFIKDKRVIFCDNLDQVIDKVEELLKN